MKLRSNGSAILTAENEALGAKLVPLPAGWPVSNAASTVTAWQVTAVAMSWGMLTYDSD